ncbi:unnamed protein product, partial [Closterium sp. NIES-64]
MDQVMNQSSPSLGTWPWERRTVLLLSAETDAAPLLSILFSPPRPPPVFSCPSVWWVGSTLAGRVVEGDEDAFMRAVREAVQEEDRKAFVQEQSAEEARASVGGSSGDGRDAGGMEACQGQSHRGDHGSRERGAQSARAGESGGKEGLP